MQNKLVVIVLDGLRYDTATLKMGYLNHLVEKNVAKRWRIQAELPSMSRPLYETILTGVSPYQSGITNNYISRLSKNESVFSVAKKHHKITAAAAYHWISELYNKAPYDYLMDRYQFNTDLLIMNGLFYHEDTYPDNHLFMDAEFLRQTSQPDLLYIHPMNIDDSGHKYGGESKEYQSAAIKADVILSNFIPLWVEAGYQIMVTSDHGMDEFGNHGGTTLAERDVPLYIISHQNLDHLNVIKQVQLASLMCNLLGVEPAATMPNL